MDSTKQQPVSPLSCCAFCLGTKPSNAEFHKQVTGCSPEQRQCFQLILGYDFRIDTFAVCKPCWKFMELVQDFRLRCLKANSMVVGRIYEGQLLERAEDDGWFTETVLTGIESIQTEIQRQLQELVRLEMAVKKSKQREESTVEADEIKVEPIEICDGSNETSLNDSEMEFGSDDKSNSSTDEVAIEKTSLGFFKCKKCSESYTTEKGVKHHLLTCDGKHYLFTCKLCKAKFIEHKLLQKHLMQTQHDKVKKVFICRQQCGKSFTNQYNRSRHEKKCIIGNRKCGLCNEELDNHKSCLEHLQLVHSKLIFSCAKCDKQFKSIKELTAHERRIHTESRDVPCPKCGKLFSEAKDLMVHLKREQCGERLPRQPKTTHAEASKTAEQQKLARNPDYKADERTESAESRDRKSSGFKLKSLKIINP